MAAISMYIFMGLSHSILYLQADLYPFNIAPSPALLTVTLLCENKRSEAHFEIFGWKHGMCCFSMTIGSFSRNEHYSILKAGSLGVQNRLPHKTNQPFTKWHQERKHFHEVMVDKSYSCFKNIINGCCGFWLYS